MNKPYTHTQRCHIPPSSSGVVVGTVVDLRLVGERVPQQELAIEGIIKEGRFIDFPRLSSPHETKRGERGLKYEIENAVSEQKDQGMHTFWMFSSRSSRSLTCACTPRCM